MPQHITLYLSPYLRLYLLAKLGDRERAANDVDARELWQKLGHLLGGRLVLVENDYSEQLTQSGKVYLQVELREGVLPDRPWRVNEAQAELQRRYQSEMCLQVDWYRAVLNTTARHALGLFRARYSISEDDHAFRSAERYYHRYRQRSGASRPYSRRNSRIRPKVAR